MTQTNKFRIDDALTSGQIRTNQDRDALFVTGCPVASSHGRVVLNPLWLLGGELFWLVLGRPKWPGLVRNVEQLGDGHFGRILGYFFAQPFWLTFCYPKQPLVFRVP